MSNEEDHAVDQEPVEDTQVPENPDENEFSPNRFNISSYGWDSDVEGLVKRLKRGDIHVPGFQRNFIWHNSDKSRFIESLIIGLPVPNVFLAQDPVTKNLNIVDGQQRLLTLRDFIDGKFYLSGQNLQDDLRRRYFSKEVARSSSSKVISEADARALSDAVIHSIVIKPDPADDDPEKGHEYNQAVIQIFRRLNTSGRPLQAQEIRASIFYGSLDGLLRALNEDTNWRALFGPPHSRLRDLELILRYIALLHNHENYTSPMPRFLDTFMEENRDMEADIGETIADEFSKITSSITETLGVDGLKRGSTFVVSRFDAVMIGFCHHLRRYGTLNPDELKKRYAVLEEDEKYIWSVEKFVNDTDRVKTRIRKAIEILGA